MRLRSQRRRRRTAAPAAPPAAVLAVITIVGGVVAAALARLRRGRADTGATLTPRGGSPDGGATRTPGGGSPDSSTTSVGTPAASGPVEWHCECGQAYRVVGEGRHRVFWLPDAAEDDPVLEDACPQCERRLSTQA